MDKWDERYLNLAEQISSWSKDPSTQVGCVIINSNEAGAGVPVSFGYNGFPRGLQDSEERLSNREYKNQHMIHAEHNALIFSRGKSLFGAKVYVTHPPCSRCMGMMRQYGVSSVVCYEASKDFQTRWGSTDKTLEEAKELGIAIKVYKKED